MRGNNRVTFRFCETTTPCDDNHFLTPKFTGRDIWHLPALFQRYTYAYTTTRDGPPQLAAVLGQEPIGKPMENSSEAILALKPVTFRYKKELDPDKIPHFGLIAEEVDKVDPNLVVHDQEGKPFTVRYEAVNAMLLNEFLKEHGHQRD